MDSSFFFRDTCMLTTLVDFFFLILEQLGFLFPEVLLYLFDLVNKILLKN
jgi:hypothetical protein